MPPDATGSPSRCAPRHTTALRDSLRAGVDCGPFFSSFAGYGTKPCVEVPIAVDKPNDRCVNRRRHVPGRREVGQRIHRREQSSDELSGEETGVAAAHAEAVVTSSDRCHNVLLRPPWRPANRRTARNTWPAIIVRHRANRRGVVQEHVVGRGVAPRAGWPPCRAGQGRAGQGARPTEAQSRPLSGWLSNGSPCSR